MWGHDTQLPTLTSRDAGPGRSAPPPFLVLVLTLSDPAGASSVTGGGCGSLGRDGEACRSFRRVFVAGVVAVADGTGGGAGGGEDQTRGGLRGVVGEVGQHTGVGVG